MTRGCKDRRKGKIEDEDDDENEDVGGRRDGKTGD